MFRKLTLALAAAATLCLGAVSATPAAAGWHGHHRHHHHHHGGWRARPYYGFTASPTYYDCYRTVRVATPWGPRLRRVWICG